MEKMLENESKRESNDITADSTPQRTTETKSTKKMPSERYVSTQHQQVMYFMRTVLFHFVRFVLLATL